MEVSRHFATVDGRWGPRQVHYRRAGRGPAVLLLHQSPQSSREMVALMERWALHFTVIAPDTPGYGQSDPLGPATVPIGDFAVALLEFVNAIGLRRFGVYGYHTGSSIGLWLAALDAGRVAALACNGLVQLTDAERDLILREYLPPITPRWDGGHLAWLWARMREQAVFFPWHEHTAAARMDFDMPEPGRLHAALLETLRAGDNYAVAYRAAFESRPGTILPTLATPLFVTAVDGDPLQGHLDRLADLSRDTEVAASPSVAAALDRCLAHLLAHRGDEAPGPVATRPVAGRYWNRMVTTPTGPLRVRLALAGAGEPLVFVHAAGRSADTAAAFAGPLLGTRPLVVPDLPGHGESAPAPGAARPTVDECAAACLRVAAELGLTEFIAAGEGAGACVAVESLRRARTPSARLLLLDPPRVDAPLHDALRALGFPRLEPQWHGGHLLQAWHLVRDGRLFFPWFERTRTAALRGEPDLDEARLHAELIELLKAEGAWQSLGADALDYPLADSLKHYAGQAVLGAATTSPWLAPARAVARLVPGVRLAELPAAPNTWLPAMLRALD